jgi:hypothetical protein
MKYTLKLSTDFGLNYPYEMCQVDGYDNLKKTALELEQKGEVRWVIVDESDEPLYWCQYIEANLHIPPSSAIATDDPYMEILAKRYGFRVFHTIDILVQSGMDRKIAEEKLAGMKNVQGKAKEAFDVLQTLIAHGTIEEIPSKINMNKIGKELFGDGIKN